MRVLFYYRGVESLGVGYLMSALEADGHTVDLIFDPGFDDNLYLKAPRLRFLNREQQLLERAKAFKPDLICFSILTNIFPFVRRWTRMLKEEIGVPILAGGAHVQALPDLVLNDPEIDIVCTGEGEIAIAELARRMEAGEDIRTIPGLWVKDADGTVHKNDLGPLVEDLDQFAFPHKRLWHEYGAFHENLEIFTGRGCPFRCTFCNIHYQRDLFKGTGSFLRKRTVENVMQEFRENLALYDPKMVSVHDDNFTTNREFVVEFCEAYAKEVGLPWYCFAYPTTINDDILKAMKHANCKTMFVGLDSGDEDIRRLLLERPMSDDLILRAGQAVKDAGIGIQVSCIYGHPTETPDQMFKTLDLMDRIQPTQSSAYIFYPFPGTKLHDYCVEHGLLDEEGQQKVKDGISGYHHESILLHPHKQLAETMAKITPVYAKTPTWGRPLLRWIIRREMSSLALALYVVLIPVTFPFLGLEGITITLKMAWRGLTGRVFRPSGEDPLTSLPVSESAAPAPSS